VQTQGETIRRLSSLVPWLGLSQHEQEMADRFQRSSIPAIVKKKPNSHVDNGASRSTSSSSSSSTTTQTHLSPSKRPLWMDIKAAGGKHRITKFKNLQQLAPPNSNSLQDSSPNNRNFMRSLNRKLDGEAGKPQNVTLVLHFLANKQRAEDTRKRVSCIDDNGNEDCEK